LEWGTIAIGLGGIGVAALSLVLALRERTAALRGALYTTQAESFGAIMAALDEFHRAMLAFTTEAGLRLDAQTRPQLRAATVSQNHRFSQTWMAAAIFLPKAVAEALTEYQKIFNAISAPPDVEKQYSPELVRSHDPQMALSDAHTRVVQAMRKHLGTDPLSGQTLALFGRSE
jgi:hypothetical protein